MPAWRGHYNAPNGRPGVLQNEGAGEWRDAMLHCRWTTRWCWKADIYIDLKCLGGGSFKITIDHKHTDVSDLKRAIQDAYGTPVYSQLLFWLGARGDKAKRYYTNEANEDKEPRIYGAMHP